VKAVDATAAGDAFNGALAVALSEGRPLEDAIVFANGAGALAASGFGAQSSLCTRNELDRFLKSIEESPPKSPDTNVIATTGRNGKQSTH
ncbi:MAG: PfkB family carbohydrate kinase, partial [Mangrovibacterium sp.]|nr:PfkB family carbohydrate kinase [Mangrovibacterium sp.]